MNEALNLRRVASAAEIPPKYPDGSIPPDDVDNYAWWQRLNASVLAEEDPTEDEGLDAFAHVLL